MDLIRGHEGEISQHDYEAYMAEVDQAFAIHLNKERIRHGLWKEYPARDQANQVKIKIDRVLRSLELIQETEFDDYALAENAIEEMQDIINYAIFTIRKLKEERA